MRQLFFKMTAMSKNVVASVALLLDEEEQARKKRRTWTIWTRPWMLRRKTDGAFHTIHKELKEQNSDGFKGYVRMDVDHFEELVHHLSGVVFSSSDSFCFSCTFLLFAILLQNILDRMFWFILNFRWIWLDEGKNVSENLFNVPGHVGFLMFSHLQHKSFVAETKKGKSCKTKKFNMGTR